MKFKETVDKQLHNINKNYYTLKAYSSFYFKII